jgi:hypothetical protein
MGDLDHEVLEHLTCYDPLDGRRGIFNGLTLAIPDDEVAPIRLYRSTETVQTFDSVHRERGFVDTGDHLVGLDEDHALSKPSDNLL